MITEFEAIEIATAFLKELESEGGGELAFKGDVEITQTGFTFSSDGKRMIEEMDPQFALAGNMPIVVDQDGTVGVSSVPDPTS